MFDRYGQSINPIRIYFQDGDTFNDIFIYPLVVLVDNGYHKISFLIEDLFNDRAYNEVFKFWSDKNEKLVQYLKKDITEQGIFMRDFEFTSSDGNCFIIAFNYMNEILVKNKFSPFNQWWLLNSDILSTHRSNRDYDPCISSENGKEILDFMNRVLNNKALI